MEESTVKLVDGVPSKLTVPAPVKFVPVMVTLVPTGPLVGVKEEIVGAPRAATPVAVNVNGLPDSPVEVAVTVYVPESDPRVKTLEATP